VVTVRYVPKSPSFMRMPTPCAYLFQGDDIGLFAVSLDKSGRNIPRSSCPEGWRLKLSSPSPSPNQYR
jgi:hypothetical protein